MAGKREVLLSDEQWEKVKTFIPEVERTRHGGRPRADDRACLEGILWVLRSGARWKDLPDWYPRQARAGVGWPNGRRLACSSKCGMRSSTNWTSKVALTGTKFSWTEVLPQQKKGRRRG